jgi:UrcA family protein
MNTGNTARPLALLAIGMATMLSAIGPAHASDPDTLLTRRVSLQNLDLNAPEDVAVAHRLLRHAARDVCTYSSAPNAYSDTCVEQAMDRAVAALDRPQLTAWHGARSRR